MLFEDLADGMTFIKDNHIFAKVRLHISPQFNHSINAVRLEDRKPCLFLSTVDIQSMNENAISKSPLAWGVGQRSLFSPIKVKVIKQ
jgi:hypothetical protein